MALFRKRKSKKQEINEQDRLEKINIEDEKESKRQKRKNKLEKKKKDKKVKVSTGEFVAEKILNRFTQGALDSQSQEFQIGSEMIMSLTHCKKVIQIFELPEYIKPATIESLTKLVKSKVPPSRITEVGVSILETCIPRRISMADKKVKSTERNLRRQEDVLEEDIRLKLMLLAKGENINTTRDSINHLTQEQLRLQRKIYSFDYINRDLTTGVEVLSSFIFIEITCKDTNLLTDVTREVVDTLNRSNFKAMVITNLKQYLKEFGLAELRPKERPTLKIEPVMSTSKLSALSTTYEQGMIRSRTSDVYIGHEITQNYPAYISYSESSDKFVELILAESGSGKTLMCVTRSIFALNHTGGTYKQVIRDYKGDEGWTKVAQMVKDGKVVSMNVAAPSFINTLVIPDNPERFNMTHKQMFQLCASYTAKILTVLVGAGASDISSINRAIYESICSDIVGYAYKTNGIDAEDRHTYKLADRLPFAYTIWDAIKFICSDSEDYAKKYNRDRRSEVKTALQPYFTTSGEKSYMFEKAISIEDILDSSYVVFNYGLKAGAGDITLASKDILFRNIQETFFVRLYAAYNKLHNNHTLYWVEDVQAQYDNVISMKDLNDIITIGRGINIKPILITNEITGLFRSESTDVSALKENINNVTIGKLKESTALDMLRYLGMTEGFERSRPVFKGYGKYKHTFLVLMTSGGMYTGGIVRVLLPKHVVESPIFTTTDVEGR